MVYFGFDRCSSVVGRTLCGWMFSTMLLYGLLALITFFVSLWRALQSRGKRKRRVLGVHQFSVLGCGFVGCAMRAMQIVVGFGFFMPYESCYLDMAAYSNPNFLPSNQQPDRWGVCGTVLQSAMVAFGWALLLQMKILTGLQFWRLLAGGQGDDDHNIAHEATDTQTRNAVIASSIELRKQWNRWRWIAASVMGVLLFITSCMDTWMNVKDWACLNNRCVFETNAVFFGMRAYIEVFVFGMFLVLAWKLHGSIRTFSALRHRYKQWQPYGGSSTWRQQLVVVTYLVLCFIFRGTIAIIVGIGSAVASSFAFEINAKMFQGAPYVVYLFFVECLPTALILLFSNDIGVLGGTRKRTTAQMDGGSAWRRNTMGGSDHRIGLPVELQGGRGGDVEAHSQGRGRLSQWWRKIGRMWIHRTSKGTELSGMTNDLLTPIDRPQPVV